MNPEILNITQGVDDSLFWFVMGLLGALSLHIIDKLFGDYWYVLSFHSPRYSQKLSGSASRIIDLKGDTYISGKKITIDIGKHVERPTDGLEYAVSQASLRTKRNNDALLEASISWTTSNGKWTAKIKGKGKYFPRDPNNFVGYTYLVCEGEARMGDLKEKWTAIYILQSRAALDGWNGYWMMFDGYDAGEKFGRIDLHNTH